MKMTRMISVRRLAAAVMVPALVLISALSVPGPAVAAGSRTTPRRRRSATRS